LTFINAPGTADDVTIGYDHADNRESVVVGPVATPVVSSSFDFDVANRLKSRDDIIAGKVFATQYSEYDGRDNVGRITYPSGLKIDYQYDSADRITSVETDGAAKPHAAWISYHPSGAVKSFKRSWTQGDPDVEFVNFDSRYRPTRIVSGPLGVSYALYDGVGNLKTLNDDRGTAFSSTFEYDALDRLETVTGFAASGFTYDGLGNRRTKTIGTSTVTYNYDEAGTGAKWRLTGTTGGEVATYTYENVGNLSAASGTGPGTGLSYTYTPFNMIATATAGSAVTSYAYDGDNLRKWKSGADGTRYYVHAPGSQLLGEYKLQSPTVVVREREYIYLGSRLLASIGEITGGSAPTSGKPESPTEEPEAQDVGVWKPIKGLPPRAIGPSNPNPNAVAAMALPIDRDEDGKTDWTVVRNTGGGPTGAITW
jgi:hypothetical protein